VQAIAVIVDGDRRDPIGGVIGEIFKREAATGEFGMRDHLPRDLAAIERLALRIGDELERASQIGVGKFMAGEWGFAIGQK